MKKYVIVLFWLLINTSSYSQSFSSCPISLDYASLDTLIDNDCVEDITVYGSKRWLLLKAYDTTASIDLYKIAGATSIKRIDIYQGSCPSLILKDTISCSSDSSTIIILYNLQVGSLYYLELQSEIYDIITINFCVNYYNSVPVCSPSNCFLVSNPSFETNTVSNATINDPFNPNAHHVDCWLRSHGSPQLFTIGGGVNGSNYYAGMWTRKGGGDGSQSDGEGIYSNVNIQNGKKYILNYFVKTDGLVDRFEISLLKSTTVSPPPLYFTLWANYSFPAVGTVPTIPLSEKQIISYSTNLTNTNWVQVTECFTANADYAYIWIYPKNTINHFDQWVYVDEVQIVELDVDAGNDVSVNCGIPEIIGGTTCTPIPFVNYYWNPSIGLSCNNCSNPIANPTSSTTYTLTGVSSSGGCFDSDVVTVSVFSNPDSPIITQISPSHICYTSNLQYQITNYNTSNIYLITVNGGSVVGGISSSGVFNVSWFSQSLGGDILITVTNSAGCKNSGSYHLDGCCFPDAPDIQNFVDADVFAMNIIPGYTYTTGTSTVNVSGKTFYINGTFTVDQNLTFVNCRVNFGPNAKINVINGKTFTITQLSVLKAGCEIMWDGVYVDGASNSRFNMGNTDFLDAINGVISKDGAQLTITGSRFNKNRIAIEILPFIGTHPATISGNTFSCVPSVYTQPNIYLLPPYSLERGLFGIYVKGSGLVQNDIQIGNPSTPAAQNLFTTGLRIGIRVEKANVKVYNCKFNDISDQKIGKAIWAVGRIPTITPINLNQYKLTVGGIGTNEPCDFMNCTNAVYTDTCMRSDIIKNKVDRSAAGGLVLASGFSINNITAGIQTVNIIGNNIKNMDVGILCNRNTRCQTNIKDLNTIDHTWYATSTATKVGIVVTDINSTNGLYFIYNNDIKDVQIGVNLKSVNKAIVEGNRINVRSLAAVLGARAIFVSGNVQAQIKNNQLKAIPAASSNTNVKGVFVQGSQSTKVYCNDIQNIGACIHFDGNTTIAASVGNNFMKNGARGIWLSNGTALGNQGAPAPLNIASDNKWQGIVDETYTSGLIGIPTIGNNSRIFYRNVGFYKPIDNNSNFVGGSTQMIPQIVSPTYLPVTCAYPVGGGDHRLMQLIAKDSADLSTQELKWLAKHGVYAIIKEDSSAYYNDTLLIRFKDSLQYENLGKLYEVQKTVGENGDILTAEGINNGVNTIDAKESYSKMVNQLLIEQQFAETTFDSTQLYTLQSIAALCPYTEGPAVYLARALVYPYNRMEYTNSCEEFIEGRIYEPIAQAEDDIKEITVYPNPANDLVNISYNLQENQVGKIQIYDIAGALVLDQSLNSKNNLSIINTSKLNAGIYLYHIFVDNEREQSNKLIIVK